MFSLLKSFQFTAVALGRYLCQWLGRRINWYCSAWRQRSEKVYASGAGSEGANFGSPHCEVKILRPINDDHTPFPSDMDVCQGDDANNFSFCINQWSAAV